MTFLTKSISRYFNCLRLLIVCSFFFTGLYGQDAPDKGQLITLQIKKAPLKEVLLNIEGQSSYRFIYSPKDADRWQLENIVAKNVNIQEVLRLISKQVPFVFEISGRQIGMKKVQVTDQPVRGRVVDEKEQPLPGVVVRTKNGDKGVITDAEGTFSFHVTELHPLLTFSCIGYNTRKIYMDDGDNQPSVIRMVPTASQLNDLVVVGYNRQKKANLTGAVASIKEGDFANRPITDATQSIQGYAAGVYVNQASGQPGKDAASILIRGAGSFDDQGNFKATALVLVDGIQSDLSAVSPSDIARVDVLKDAASAAIYGARAANGVILITTKSGEEGKARIQYNNYFGIQQATRLPNVVDNSGLLMETYNRALTNEMINEPSMDNLNMLKNKMFTQATIDSFKNGKDSYLYPNTNWMKVLFHDAFVQQHNINISGGTKNTRTYLSLNYLDQDGILTGTNAKRYNVNAKFDGAINDRLHYGFKFNGALTDSRESATGTWYAINLAFRAQPYQTPLLPDGRYGNTWLPASQTIAGIKEFRNPLALTREGYTQEKTQTVLAQSYVNWDILPSLAYAVTAGVSKLDYLYDRFTPQVYSYDPKTGAASSSPIDFWGQKRGTLDQVRNNTTITVYNTLTYKKNLSSWGKVNVLGGFSSETFNGNYVSAGKDGSPANNLSALGANTVNPTVDGYPEAWGLRSWFGRGNLAIKDKYFLETNLRYDGSSRFREGRRWGLFPSASGAWIISQESFFPHTPLISFLKLRGSYGSLGNQDIGYFRYLNKVDLNRNYIFNNQTAPGAAVTQLADPNISWETTSITDAGLDMELFNGNLTVTFDYYNKITHNILRAVTISAVAGDLSGPTRNIGAVQNKGWELGLQYHHNWGAFSYAGGLNVSRLKNRVTNLKGEVYYYGNRVIKEGYPINSYYLLKTAGLFQRQDDVKAAATITAKTAPGDIKYVDITGDGKIDNNDRYITGNAQPDWTLGTMHTFSYKGFELQVMLQGVLGVYSYPQLNLVFPFNNGASITQDWLKSWTPENTGAKLPRLTTNAYEQNFRASDFWLQNASYLRLKNLQLGYTLPARWLNSAHIRQCKVFVNAQNLLTWTSYRGMDPERSILNDQNYDYPNVRTFSAGINLSLF